MTKRRASWRETALAWAAAMIIICWVGLSLVGEPLWKRSADLERQMMVAQKKLERLQQLAARQGAIEQAVRAWSQFWSDQPDEQLQQEYLEELERLAATKDLHLNVKPHPIRRQGEVSRFEVELEVESSQEQLLAFLDQLLAHPSLLELDRLRISSTASKDHPLKADCVISKVVIKTNTPPTN